MQEEKRKRGNYFELFHNLSKYCKEKFFLSLKLYWMKKEFTKIAANALTKAIFVLFPQSVNVAKIASIKDF